ncbi:MAG: hypothetical protein ACD_30C00052G0003 [uncultured bacterium]|uniref:UDP-N-acetylglucosamine 1-carboxyvinyltransferase n=3 Tax=Candidatus Daviesiibacteriota TaxID=1752718 RepID=A0A0G0HZD2_9BACT|nr:MAG: hypothetical protein ACD_30C00052G0003 [uncultured bacterium]KKQ09186.1 MAG: UDP-N-acetylglucosamine 1-carboxyvinyltransferase [Candidatus Daviesbacteria bacterium GW2011_GWB1_36_5]KKQ14783.1 MAG: UDP-N-acetylglucosamine 1-carboxyvinyltransferase [Candidatus Daviesbacteria bacterium GW2011_GWA1_36_8]OGE16420.1 MAG: UDP-N-acetylglucosamine 1-carboxyvinyltransferase [Candidatus Daviesbacteria bacterium RIFCSPHIGHO2_01_FULL_36_37]
MAKYIIEGGKKLKGTIKIGGNKNSVFPAFAACLLTEDEVVLRNIPEIEDVRVSIGILKKLGVKVQRSDDIVRIQAKNIETSTLPPELTYKLRGAVVFAGGVLGRIGRVEFTHPGGDVIGKRSIQTHLDGFEALGYEVKVDDLKYFIQKKNNKENYIEFFMEESSVTATENLILVSVLGDQKIVLKNCAKEPHVVDLCKLLILMGANIEGVGGSRLTITGVQRLNGAQFNLGADYLEFASYAIAALLTKGKIKLEGISLEDLEPIVYPLIRMGGKIEASDTTVTVKAERIKNIEKLTVNVWPGFPTDLMSLFIVLATQAQGASLLHDWMYESRMFFVDKLISMGAQIDIADPHRVIVIGPTKLYGRDLETPDIRAGMALVLAALAAKGSSTINKAELIERGYEDVVEKLSSLGAKIKRED